MKKFLLFASCVALLASCTPKVPQTEYDALKAQKDSIENAHNQMEEMLGAISTTMSDMASEEGLIFVDDNGNDLKDKQAVLNRMKIFRDHMADQRQQLEKLKKKANDAGYAWSQNKKLKELIENLESQIAEKDAKIAEMESTLSQKNASIADLMGKLTIETAAKQAAEEVRDHYIEVSHNQDLELNTGYYIMDTKANLKAAGLLEGGFFSKKRANYANLDNTKFQRVDIRELTNLKLNSKKPKLITEKPEGSYRIDVNEDGSSNLVILNVTEFWKASPYLIIQL